ncbi:MAG: sigma-70 family RNA polymerase sigma factor, partial [Bacteroidota bacterium]
RNIIRVIHRICRDEIDERDYEARRDLAQDVLINFMTYVSRQEVKVISPYGLASRMATAKCREWKRSETKRREIRETIAPYDTVMPYLRTRNNHEYDYAIILQCVEGLPVHHQHLLKLIMDGYNHSEIAQELDIRIDLIRKRLYRIRERLKVQFRALGYIVGR